MWIRAALQRVPDSTPPSPSDADVIVYEERRLQPAATLSDNEASAFLASASSVWHRVHGDEARGG